MASSYRHSGAKRSARRANEGADLLGVLHAGRAFDAGGDIDARSARDAQRLGDIDRIEAAREQVGKRQLEAFEQMPVERLAETARACGITRRARVEQQAIGDAGV